MIPWACWSVSPRATRVISTARVRTRLVSGSKSSRCRRREGDISPNAASVAHQSAGLDESTKLIDGGHAVAQRRCAELFAPAIEEGIVTDHESAGLQAAQVRENSIDVAFGGRLQDVEL